jgi:integrase
VPRDVSDAEIRQLFGQTDHPRGRLMFNLMCGLGLRVGEVAALRLSDFIPSSDHRVRSALSSSKDAGRW